MAIKQIFIGDSQNKIENANELQKEVEILKQYQHPNIVQYYGSEIQGQNLKIFLEYVDMGSISQMLEKYGNFAEEVVIRFTK